MRSGWPLPWMTGGSGKWCRARRPMTRRRQAIRPPLRLYVVSPGRHLQDGHRHGRGGRSRAAGQGRRGPPRGRCINHAGDRLGEHQRGVDSDRLARGGVDRERAWGGRNLSRRLTILLPSVILPSFHVSNLGTVPPPDEDCRAALIAEVEMRIRQQRSVFRVVTALPLLATLLIGAAARRGPPLPRQPPSSPGAPSP